MALFVNEFINFPKNILSPDITNRNYVIQNCIRLKNYLLHFKNNNLCDNNKCCGYFNFWLNEIARKDEPIKEITSSHYENCINYYSRLIGSNKCFSEIYYIENSEFEKKQELYHLYDYYNAYNSITFDYSKCSFSNFCAKKYNHIIGKCNNVEDDDFCKELKNFGNDFLKKILISKEHCKEKIVELLSPEDAILIQEEEEEEEDEGEVEEVGEGEEKVEEEHLQPQEEELTVKVPPGQVGLEDVAVVEAKLESGEGGGIPSARVAAGKIPGYSDSEIFVEHQNSNTSKPIGTIIGTSFGFFIPLTMLYKFTPLGNWVNTKVLGRDKLMDNMKKNELEFLLNNTQTQDVNSGDTIYRIKYNSALNE
ncbi:Plasmodium vivax Vir protein, putative [Plasmodium vivax]|uniref:Vir protein, putative n=1 Tax=Plasmodium vivax TaxID=5855 RepID=A0A1G4E5M3_PLAVI|nr:Plasmodium vivax Vir protein, putative [Plasmodium vivax]